MRDITITLSDDMEEKVEQVRDAYNKRVQSTSISDETICKLMVEECCENWLSEIRHGEHFTT